MEFLQQSFFNNTLQDWLTALAVGLLSLACAPNAQAFGLLDRMLGCGCAAPS